MRWRILVVIFFITISAGLCTRLYAFENKLTHPTLTDKAIEVDNSIVNYLKTQLGLNDALTTELYWDFPADIKERIKWGESEPEKTTRTILEWIKVGSIIEDEDGRIKLPSIRPRHHFHAPIANPGVSPPNPNAGLENILGE